MEIAKVIHRDLISTVKSLFLCYSIDLLYNYEIRYSMKIYNNNEYLIILYVKISIQDIEIL
jgi:hypothetical protein